MNIGNGAGMPSPGGIKRDNSHRSLCNNIPLEQFSSEEKTEANLLSRSFIANSEMATSEMHLSAVSSTCRSTVLSDAERREKNRLAQQKYRRNQRNELTLLRIRSASLSRREQQIREHIAKLTQEKAVAEAKADVQSKLISKLRTRLNVVVCDFSKLHAQFEALKHIHCELLKQNATLRIIQIESESQSQDSLQTGGEHHS